jgi:hypothetical protein
MMIRDEHRRLTSGRVALLCAAAASLASCTKFASELDGVTTPELRTEPVDDKDTAWNCLSTEAGNPVMQNNGPPLDYPIQALNYLSGATPANMRIRACYRGDVACAHPATDYLPADAYGVVTMPLTVGFSGFLEIVTDDMVPTLFVFPAPLTPELTRSLSAAPVALLPVDALLAFGAAAAINLDPGAGVLSVNAYDCTAVAAAGVRLELNAPAVPFTFVDGLPIAFTDTTTDEGNGGFANVFPGLVIVRGFRAGTQDIVGLETTLIRAQWVTITSLMPQFAGED